MSWFVPLTMKTGTVIHVRPEMVKAVYLKPSGNVNIVVDGHDFDVDGTIDEILDAVQYHMVPEER